jgi:hypothetical protein
MIGDHETQATQAHESQPVLDDVVVTAPYQRYGHTDFMT